uniref:Uncharacterized protein n=1 Tax=Pavo cristatus TaxID=9049 RepID=A0A8C9F7F8_PAVCR
HSSTSCRCRALGGNRTKQKTKEGNLLRVPSVLRSRENTKLLVACAPALKCDHKGYTGKLERTDDHTAGKMVVGYLVQSRGLEEQWNNLLSSCQLSWLVLKVPAGVRDCERVCECTREGKSWGFLSRTSKCVP